MSWFEPDGIAAMLHAAGLREVAFLPPAEARARYFDAGRRDLRAPRQTNIVSAIR